MKIDREGKGSSYRSRKSDLLLLGKTKKRTKALTPAISCYTTLDVPNKNCSNYSMKVVLALSRSLLTNVALTRDISVEWCVYM
ncbi:hypothetical protein CEXT_507501 [Caerostris extrusa]|uniref:Uncharacterized protein n=1 Tax=Caerostris extrusa TaxID=172846 RepID=A0AAV4N919_CAEEX|nr:hypothetical protein CEXT_507501 [Caerostris extrusa]